MSDRLNVTDAIRGLRESLHVEELAGLDQPSKTGLSIAALTTLAALSPLLLSLTLSAVGGSVWLVWLVLSFVVACAQGVYVSYQLGTMLVDIVLLTLLMAFRHRRARFVAVAAGARRALARLRGRRDLARAPSSVDVNKCADLAAYELSLIHI